MATRRTNAVPSAVGEKAAQGEFAQPLGQPSITAPAVPMWVPQFPPSLAFPYHPVSHHAI